MEVRLPSPDFGGSFAGADTDLVLHAAITDYLIARHGAYFAQVLSDYARILTWSTDHAQLTALAAQLRDLEVEIMQLHDRAHRKAEALGQ